MTGFVAGVVMPKAELMEKCQFSDTLAVGRHCPALPKNGITNVQTMLSGCTRGALKIRIFSYAKRLGDDSPNVAERPVWDRQPCRKQPFLLGFTDWRRTPEFRQSTALLPKRSTKAGAIASRT